MNKLQLITAKYNETVIDIASRHSEWMSFMDCAANNYKYSFSDQVLIYTQKPAATACAEIALWNERFGRWVNKGAKGIALLDNSGEKARLRYVFDVSDTNSRNGREVELWKVGEKYHADITAALENAFGDIVEDSNLSQAIMQTAYTMADDNLVDYRIQLFNAAQGSYFQDLDKKDCERILVNAVGGCVAYMMMTRCGLNAREHYDFEAFRPVLYFNTADTVAILGNACSDIAEMGLREIESTVRHLQKEEKNSNRTFVKSAKAEYDEAARTDTTAERSKNDDRDSIHEAGRLSDTEANSAAAAGVSASNEVRDASQDLPYEPPERDIHNIVHEQRAEPTSVRDTDTGGRNDTEPDKTDGGESGSDREAESGEPDALGSEDEQYRERGTGDSADTADLPLSAELPSVEEQQQNIAESEAATASDFSISQEDIDAVLTHGSGVSQGKLRIYEQYLKKKTAAENIKMLTKEYGIGGSYPVVSERRLSEDHNGKGIRISRTGIAKPDASSLLPWSKVGKRIGELIAAERYLSEKEKEYFPTFRRERADREARWKISEAFRSLIYDYNDYWTQLGEPDKCLNQYHLSFCWQAFGTGEKKMHARISEGEYILPMMREALCSIISEDTHHRERAETLLEQLSGELAMRLEPTYDELNQPPEPEKEYRFSLGDTVYLGVGEYEILSYGEETVRLYDTSFPLFNKEYPRAEFDRMVQENPMNDHLKVEVTAPAEKRTDYTDAFFVDSENESITWMYYNPDSNAGGQYVTNTLTFAEVRDVLANIDPEDFFDELGSIAYQELADIGSPWFEEAEAQFNSSPDLMNCTEQTREALYELTKEPSRTLWQEYSTIKEHNPDRLVLFQVGDFFEIMGDEAQLAANALSVAVTHRTEPNNDVIPIVGIPASTLDENSEKFRLLGYDVVIAPLEGSKRNEYILPSLKTDEDKLAEKEKKTEPEPPKWEQKPKGKTQSFDLHPEVQQAERNNFHISDDGLGVGTPSERYANNIAAIRMLKTLEAENRFATQQEQQILAKYVGWGGLSDCFRDDNSHYGELKGLLSEDEYASARESTLTAFYTPPAVIRSVYEALANMDFQTGNILEPSCGIGNFIGMLPDSMSESRIYGVELDSVSGRIAQQLYQKSSIAVRGFEKTDLPDSFFDAAIGNVPFGQFKVSDKKYDKHNWLIHDYFFGRTLDKVRPGGVIAFITSKGTLDKENPSVRRYIAQRADLLGAIRLPNNTFKSAAGTEATSDIIFLQKRERLIDIEPDWVHLGKNDNGITMNRYFIDNPEMIMGEMKIVSGQFGPESACVPYEGQDLGMMLADAVADIHGEVITYVFDSSENEEDNSIPADPQVRNFSYAIVDGKIYFRENSRMNPVDVSVTAESRIKGMIAIRDSVCRLIEYQTEDYPDADIKAEQSKLNELYDEFSKKYGLINARANSTVFGNDSSYFLLTSLEILDDEGKLVRKADMFSKRTIKQKSVVTFVDTASEALSVSLSEKAKIDMEYMEQLTGKSEQDIFENLKGVIFLNPMHVSANDGEPKYLTADEYLSGNVREKLIWARRSAELYEQDYAANVQALEEVQPVELTASDISVRLGATWLPLEIIERFMFELFSTPRYCQWNIKVHFSEYTGEWNVEGKSYDRGNVKAFSTYGTDRINGYKIIEETLNLRDVRIFDYVEDDQGRKQAVLNRKETAIAQGKQELIKSAFQDWIWQEPERRQQLCKLYNEKFNSNRPREYDGSFLNFVGMNPEITLRKHQVDAVARGLLGGNELLAHVVGSGKTFTMVAIAQESKRLGLCNKSLFVVPNHLTEQWAAEYLQLYPAANILVTSKKDFETKNRKKFCGRISTGDYDAVIIGHTQFEKIPMSVERQRAILEQQLQEILNGIADMRHNRGDNFSIKQLERTKKAVKQKIEKLNDQSRKDDIVTFEELGVDRLFVDEAHYYKNLAAFSKMRNVGGISQTEAQKSSDLYMKCRYLDELTHGRGIVFATGTPVSNSMVELYTMQKYLQYNTLKKNGLIHFDAWASTFGETVTAIELAPEGYNLIGR